MQTVYVIENNNPYVVNPDVTLGSAKWVDIERFNDPNANNTAMCIKALKKKGYRIVGTTVKASAPSVFELDTSAPIALVFGHEKNGISDTVLNNADTLVHIPMYGFVESFNISVSAALSLYPLYNEVRASDVHWKLSDECKLQIKLDWFRKIVPRADIVESEYWKKHREEC
jgi:tRNA (guanosine-2'-O-)-methyltransferase